MNQLVSYTINFEYNNSNYYSCIVSILNIG